MKKLNKKGGLIGIGIIFALCCCIAIILCATEWLEGNSNDSYTVSFELCTDLQTTTVLDKTVSAGDFLEEPEVYVTGDNAENWSISGWYTEPEYEMQWDFDFDTVESDLTLYAKWEAKPECMVSFYTEESAEPVYITKVRKGLVASQCDEEFIGREVLGYYADKSMTQVFDFEREIEEDTNVYVDISDYVYFNAKTLAKWNLCGNQSEATKYKMATTLSADETVYTITSADGGYLWLSNLSLSMNDTSIIEIKAREVNDNYSGVIGGYITGDYSVNGELGGSSDFGQTNTGALIYGRSAKPDEDGFYTYTYNIGNLTPGLLYDKMTGIRIDFYGTDTYRYEIKEVKSYVDKYAVSSDAFQANGIDFNGLHLNTFALMGGAETEMLENGDLRFGGTDGAFIFKKDIEIALGEEQLIRLKARGDLNGGAIALFLYGDYTLNGKSGTTTDYTAEHMIYFTPVSTDARGYTIYTADISSVSGLKYKVIRGMRLDLYGEGTRTIEIQSMKSYAPSKEDLEVQNDFITTGLNFVGAHLSQFLTYGDAKLEKLSNGNVKFGGPDGAMIYKKDIEIKLGKDQIITLKAKGDLKGGAIALFVYGDYTQNGISGSKKDYDAEHMWIMQAGETDKKGFTTYTVNINSIKGLKYNVIRGLRLDLYGNGTRTIEIASMKSSKPDKKEEGNSGKEENTFKMNGLNLTGAHLNQFSTEGNAQIILCTNGNLKFSGPDSAFIFKKDMEITLGKEQIITLKAKGDLKGGAIGLYLYGDYIRNGVSSSKKDYNAEHMWTMQVGETDAEGYTTYIVDIGSVEGLKYDVIRGLRLDLYGNGSRTIEIESLKSSVAETGDTDVDEENNIFKMNGLNLAGTHLNQFSTAGNAETELLANGDFKLAGPDSAMIFKKDMEITLENDQQITLKAKGDLKGGIIGLFMYGDYTLNGVGNTKTDYDTEHLWILQAGETDAEGYTTYTANISSINGLKYNVIRGLRLDLYGNGSRTIEIESLKSSVAETGDTDVDEEDNIFKMNGLNLAGTHLNQFSTAGNAETELLANGDFKLAGPDSAMIFKKDMEITLENDQQITLKAKGDLKGGIIGLFMYGDYTLNGVGNTKTDYDTEHLWILQAGETDAEGYTTYTANISSINGLKYNVIRGLRVDLYGNGTRTIEIASMKSSVPETGDTGSGDEGKDEFKMNGLNLIGTHLIQFLKEGNAQTELLANGDLEFGGPDSAFIFKKDMEVVLGEDQRIVLKAKGELKGGAIGIYIFGDYTMNGTPGILEDYGPHMWIVQTGEVDTDGYTTYTIDIDSILGLKYQVIRGIRIDLYGNQSITIDIKSVQSTKKEVLPSIMVSPEELMEYEPLNGASVKLNQDGTFHMGGTEGAFVHKKGLNINVTNNQKLEMKAKVSSGATIGIYLFGEFTKGGEATVLNDYDGNYVWIMEAGETDAEGYTTYSLDLRETAAGISNLQWDSIKGFRIELWGNGTLSLDIKEIAQPENE